MITLVQINPQVEQSAQASALTSGQPLQNCQNLQQKGAIDFLALLQQLFGQANQAAKGSEELVAQNTGKEQAGGKSMFELIFSGILSDKELFQKFKAFLEKTKGEGEELKEEKNDILSFNLKDMLNFLNYLAVTDQNGLSKLNLKLLAKNAEENGKEVKAEGAEQEKKKGNEKEKVNLNNLAGNKKEVNESGEKEKSSNQSGAEKEKTKLAAGDAQLKPENKASAEESKNVQNGPEKPIFIIEAGSNDKSTTKEGTSELAIKTEIKADFAAFSEAEIKGENLKHQLSGSREVKGANIKGHEEAIFETILSGTKILADKNGGTTNIKLYPEELGMVRIELQVENSMVKANFFAENPQVKDFIEKNLNQLKDMLNGQNLKLDQANVGLNNFGQGKYGNEQEKRDLSESFLMNFGYEKKTGDEELEVLAGKVKYRAGTDGRVDILI